MILPQRLTLLLIVSISVVGCGLLGINKETSLQFKTAESTYSPRDTATLVMRNESTHEIGTNLCYSNLQQKQSDGSWEIVARRGSCLDYLATISPGDSYTYEKEIPSETDDGQEITPGQYRYVTEATDMSTEGELRKAEFEVTSEVFTIE